MDTQFADSLITTLEQDYDRIADHFSQTRHQPWPEFSVLADILQAGNSLVDVGCGNGRLAEFVKKIKGIEYTGIDLSQGLLAHAKTEYPEYSFVHGSMLHLPFSADTFDVVTSIAALQHVPSKTYQVKALREMYRITKPTAVLFMLNWNLYQDALPDYFSAAKAAFGSQWEPGDALVPWKNAQGELQAQRYYHGFTTDELTSVCEQAGWNVQRCELGESERNIITVAKK